MKPGSGPNPRRFALVVAALLVSLLPSGCGGKAVPSPWGQEVHQTGPVQEPGALRSALEWGRQHARTAEAALGEYYEFTARAGDPLQRARVRTRWSRLARHAAERARASLEPDPGTVERILQGPPLTLTLMMRGFHKDLVSKLDMVLVQGDRRVYAPALRRSAPRALTEGGRITAYEGELEGDFPLKELDPGKSAALEVRLEDGSLLFFDIPLARLK
ncbi:MAG: hypothetical protein HYY21_00010 [Candidatus Tectomicrobia bacterium]|nr:hypothetical protein [Candidatus Tectomicrobia bacterium]